MRILAAAVPESGWPAEFPRIRRATGARIAAFELLSRRVGLYPSDSALCVVGPNLNIDFKLCLDLGLQLFD